MMFFTHNAIVSSLFVTISLVKLISCEDPNPAAPTDLSASADAASNVGTNNPKPAQPTQAVNIVNKPTTTQQSSTTPKKGFGNNLFCNIICMPFNACRTFLGDTIRSFWQSLLKAREKIMSIYRPPVTAVNNVGS